MSDQEMIQDIETALAESGLFEEKQDEQQEQEQEQGTDTSTSDAEPASTGDENGQPEPPESMKKAMEAGWTPKDQFKGDPDAWVDYDEFNRRAPLFKRIHEQEERNKKLEKKLDSLVKWNKNVESQAYERALNELKKQQRTAVEMGDVKAFEDAEKRIEALNEQERLDIEADAAAAPKAPEQPPIPEPIQKFASENAWFDKDAEMTEYMTFRFERTVATDRTLTLEAALAKAKAETLAMFKDRAAPTQQQQQPAPQRNPNKDRPAAVLSGSQESRPRALSMSELTPEQRGVFNALKGVVTEEEFLKQLEAQR